MSTRVPAPLNSYERAWLRSNREHVAKALHGVFEGYVCHLAADDPDWLMFADGVIGLLSGEPWDEHKARGFDV